VLVILTLLTLSRHLELDCNLLRRSLTHGLWLNKGNPPMRPTYILNVLQLACSPVECISRNIRPQLSEAEIIFVIHCLQEIQHQLVTFVGHLLACFSLQPLTDVEEFVVEVLDSRRG